MSEASVAVKLVDKLSGPARAMARALAVVRAAETGVMKAAREAQAATNAAGAAIAAAGAKAGAAAAGFNKAAAAMKRMSLASVSASSISKRSTAWDKIRPGFRSPMRGGNGFIGPVLDREAQGFSLTQRLGQGVEDGVRGLSRWNSKAAQSIERWQDLSAAFMRTPFGMVMGGLGKIGLAFVDILASVASMLFSVGKLTVAFGALAAVSFTKKVVEMAAFADSAKRALSFVTGSNALGLKEFASAVLLSKQLGTNVEETVAQYTKLRSMQFSAGEAAGLVRLSTDLKAITGDASAAERALTAITQIKAKGKLQSEELVGQLAEAGVSTVLVYKELEKILGTDRNGVLGKLQKGQIDSETGLVAIVRALKAKYHVQNVGTVGEQFANETISGLWESLKNAPARMFLRIGEQIDSRPIIKGLKTLRDAFEGAFSGNSAVRFVNAMVAGLGNLIPMTVSFFEGFGTGLDRIARALSFGEAANVTQWARDAGVGVANFFAKVIEVTQKAVPIIVKALAAFFEGFDVSSVLEAVRGIDWKALATNLASIAESVGRIMKKVEKPLQGAAAISSVMAAKNPGSILSPSSYVGFGDRAQHLWNTLWNDESWSDAAHRVPHAEPAMNRETLSGLGGSPTFNATINVTGAEASDPEELARVIRKHFNKEMYRFLDGDFSQASG